MSSNARTLTYPMMVGNIKKGGYIILKEFPCKVTEICISKTGKHGHAKSHIVGSDIFTNKKYEDIFPSSHNVEVPYVDKFEYKLVDITEEGYIAIMDNHNNMREDLKLPEGEEISTEIQNHFDEEEEINLTILSAMGIDKVIAYKLER